jgi:hypothetical protein
MDTKRLTHSRASVSRKAGSRRWGIREGPEALSSLRALTV